MQLSIIGGAGVRVPLLVNGLVASDLPIGRIVLYDVDRPRLEAIAALASRFTGRVDLEVAATPEECVRDADVVFTSIRVGGIAGRARDEATAMAHGVIGQETVGPCGFAMAWRTIPAIVEYARLVERCAPHAWVVNFTNPVGIVTQAMRTATRAKVVGICDTPTELFEEVAHALGVPSAESYFDYVGLNHLGWLREVYYRGEPQLARLWERPEPLRGIYRAPLFETERVRALGMLPTEYVYYYYRGRDAYEHLKRAGTSRGAAILALNDELFSTLGSPGVDPVAVYERYLAARNAGYMQLESGASAPLARSPWAELTGYDKIALATVRAIHFNRGDIIPLDVPNRGNIPELEPDDVIEAPSVVNANGPLPVHVGALPPGVRELVVQVKDYERRTVGAALAGDREAAVEALARNPLVSRKELAATLVDAMIPA